MKPEKKLKRGLAELSNCFGLTEVVDQKTVKKKIEIQPPEIVTFQKAITNPQIVNIRFFAFGEEFNKQTFSELLSSLNQRFDDLHYLTFDDHEDSLFASNQISSVCVPSSELDRSIEPSVKFAPVTYSEQVSAFIFDSLGSKKSSRLYELLDHAIFVVGPETKHLMHVYHGMKQALAENPDIQCSLFVMGEEAERFCEFIYERFSQIISQFLGRGLGFAGWMEDSRISCNLELLKSQAYGNPFLHYIKLKLRHLIYPAEPVVYFP